MSIYYLKIHWHHFHEDEPVTLYSEVNDIGYEIRKVERFRDGNLDYADEADATGQTGLGVVPVPPIEELAEQSEFTPEEISEHEFNEVWQHAIRHE